MTSVHHHQRELVHFLWLGVFSHLHFHFTNHYRVIGLFHVWPTLGGGYQRRGIDPCVGFLYTALSIFDPRLFWTVRQWMASSSHFRVLLWMLFVDAAHSDGPKTMPHPNWGSLRWHYRRTDARFLVVREVLQKLSCPTRRWKCLLQLGHWRSHCHPIMMLVMDPTVHKFRRLQTELQQFHNRSNFHFCSLRVEIVWRMVTRPGSLKNFIIVSDLTSWMSHCKKIVVFLDA